MSKKKEVVPEIEYDKGVVLYSDGGCRGEGYSGWGLHGYHYDLHPNPKGSGNTNYIVTDKGYINKKNVSEHEATIVRPINYIDGFGSIGTYSTNNTAELLAASNAMFTASKYDIKKLSLFTDSKYVVDGINKWLPNWKKNNWYKSDGTEVSNKSEWLQVDEQFNKLTSKNIEVDVKWIKAHNGHVGNELADRYATLGVYNAMSDKVRSETDSLPAAGYWNPQTDRHPFLFNKKAYFLTKENSNSPGVYYLGDHGKDDDTMGMLQTDGSISYVELNNPSNLIEEAIKIQRFFSPGTDIITYIHLDKLFNGSVARDIERFGHGCLYRGNKHRIDLNFSDGDPVTRGLVPPRLAMRTINRINELCGILQAHKLNENHFTTTDITDCFYTLNKKNENILREEIISSTDKITSNIKYNGSVDYTLSVFFGSDMPSRNVMKKIEKKNPKVKILTMMDSENSFRYFTVISVDDGIGIWSSIASNIKFIDDSKKAK